MSLKPSKSSKIPCAVSLTAPEQGSTSERSVSQLTRSRTQYFPKSEEKALTKSKVNFSMETIYNWEKDSDTPKSPKTKPATLEMNRAKKQSIASRSGGSRDDLPSMKGSRTTAKPVAMGRKNSKLDMTPSMSSLAPCKIEKLQLSPNHDNIDGKEVCETLAKVPVWWEELLNVILARYVEKCDDDIVQNFDQVKKMTCDAVAMVAKYMQARCDANSAKDSLVEENKKLKISQKVLNNRVASLTSKLTTTEATLKSLKSNFEKDKNKLESDLSRTMADSARLKRDSQRQLKDKIAALRKATEELARLKAACVENDAMKISVSLAESDDGESSVAAEEVRDERATAVCEECAKKTRTAEASETTDKTGEILMEIAPGTAITVTPETEVDALKSLVKRMDRMVASLTSQNASLRLLAAKSKDEDNGARLVKTLQSLLRGSKKDSARLDNVVATMKMRVELAQQQRSDIEQRLAALENTA